jgi:hypothetical protein
MWAKICEKIQVSNTCLVIFCVVVVLAVLALGALGVGLMLNGIGEFVQ